MLSLPTMAASASYHHKLPHPVGTLEPFQKEVETLLAQGTELWPAAKEATAEKLHEYTGLPVTYLIKANLRVSAGGSRKICRTSGGLPPAGWTRASPARRSIRSAKRRSTIRKARPSRLHMLLRSKDAMAFANFFAFLFRVNCLEHSHT